MLYNYFKIALRNLVRHKLYTLINVLGLAIGIGFCVLVMLFIRDEYTHDAFHANRDRLYRVLTDMDTPKDAVTTDAYQPTPLMPALLEAFPDIEAGTRFLGGSALVRYGEKVFREDGAFVDPAIFRMFTLPFAHGAAESARLEENGIVLTDETSRKYFGDADPIGRVLNVDIRGKKDDFLVTGVLRDLPPNSSLTFDFLLPVRRHGNYEVGKDRWTSANGSAYVMLRPGGDPRDLESKLGPFIEQHFAGLMKILREHDDLRQEAGSYRLRFQPLREIHLDTETGYSPEERSNPAYSYVLGAIGLFVLMIACINFTTLAVARSAGRAREVGVRKVLGAVRTQIMQQFWGEALILCLVALLTGVVLAEMALPAFNEITGKRLVLRYFSEGWFALALSGLLAFVGIAAGSYPAVFLSRFHPVAVLKGSTKMAGRTALTRVLIVVQFALSILLIVSTLVMSGQMRYILTQDLGYSAGQVAVIQLFDGRDNPGINRLERLKVLLDGAPGVLGISGTNGAFTHGYDINSFRHRGKERRAWMYRIDERFLDLLEIPITEGRNFNPADAGEAKSAIMINETLAREYGWERPYVGQRLDGWNDQDVPGGPVVIGVTADFNFGSLRDKIEPVVLFVNPEWGMDQGLIKIAPGAIPETIERLRRTWAEIAPDKPFSVTFLDEDVQKQYEKEQRWMEILRSASVMAIALACMGLFGLAGQSVLSRTKEIGIRKVLGASVPGIAAMLSKEFALLVGIANLIALPAAFYAATRWLESYAYRVELGPAVFIAGGAGALAIALATVSLHAVRAARRNPVHALRYE